MLGDLLLGCRRWFNQLFCMHDYTLFSNTNGKYSVYECNKCGRMKVEE